MTKYGILLYCVVQMWVMIFVIVGTAIDMFTIKGTLPVAPCLTLWGLKKDCGHSSFSWALGGRSVSMKVSEGHLFHGCNNRQSRFKAAEAFAILSIVLIFSSIIFGFLQVFCLESGRIGLYILNLCTIATLCITWALMTDAYNNDANKRSTNAFCHPLKHNVELLGFSMKYGTGFVLLVVGWCLVVLDMFLPAVPLK